MHTYLTFVFRDSGEDAWHSESELLFDEDRVTQEIGTLGISTTPGRKERRLHFKLSHPLTPIQWSELTRWQEAGMFSAVFVSDETAEETQTMPENDQSQNDEEGAASVRKVQKLGNLTGRLIATQIYPSIIREKDALETTAHPTRDGLRGEELVAETFGLSSASGYLDQVGILDKQS